MGTDIHCKWSPNFFPPQVVGTLKPSIEMHSLPLLPVHSPSLPLCSPSLPWSFPDPAPQVVGTIQPSIEIPPIGPHLLPFTRILGPWWGLQSPFAPMWMEIGWALYFQVVGTHKHYMWSSKFFLPQMVGTLKRSIEMLLLPFTPCLLPLLHVRSLHSPSLPFAPLTPLILPWPCPTGGGDHST